MNKHQFSVRADSIGTDFTESVSAVFVLKTLEWSSTYSRCTGWPSCPVCNGIKPGHGRDEFGRLPINQGHFPGCMLNRAIQNDS